MKTGRHVVLAATAALLPLLAGCQTASDSKTIEGNVRVNKGAYTGTASPITNDIKSILMAGGLDLANPSAPTAATGKEEIAKSQVSASSTESLVAALSDGRSSTTTVSAAQTPGSISSPVRTASATKPARTEQKSSTVVALVEESSPEEKKARTVFETKLEIDRKPTQELAAINATDSPVVSDGAFSVAYPLPDSMAEPKKKATGDLPLSTADVAKSSRQAQVATSDLSQKKARVRRF